MRLRRNLKLFVTLFTLTVAGLFAYIPENKSAAPAPSPAEYPSDTFLVTKVIDGDTIQLETGEKVRYIGIDTPESTIEKNCYGHEASEYNKSLVDGKRVRLEKDVTEKDRYGRLLRYVYLEDLFINEKLVREGYANSYSYPPDVKYQEKFIEAQKVAREKGLGLWSICSINVKGSSSAFPDKDCSDFKTQKEAQDFFDANNPSEDPHKLDLNKDSIVCENLP